MLFRRAKITSPFMKRGVKKLFLRIDILSSVLKNHMKGGSFANARKPISSEAHQGAQETFSGLHRDEK
jgi:hypothetical protein